MTPGDVEVEDIVMVHGLHTGDVVGKFLSAWNCATSRTGDAARTRVNTLEFGRRKNDLNIRVYVTKDSLAEMIRSTKSET